MAEEQVELEIDATPEAAWAVVGDFAGVGDFLPGIDSFRMEGDDRIIGMFGLEIRERLVARDEEGRSITYSVVEGVPVESHRATLTVHPADGGCRVVWSFEVAPPEMMPVFADTYAKGLEALRAHLA